MSQLPTRLPGLQPPGDTVTTETVPKVIVDITRYAVSVLPADDINRKYFTLFVELVGDGWVVWDGHAYYAEDGTWQPSRWSAARFADHEDAVTLARKIAPEMTVNGRTAVDAYRRTQAGVTADA